MATYFPPQQLHGETDSVYDTIRGLGGVLYIPPGNANGVNQFVYPDDSTLAGTVGGAPTFDQSGLVPEILGGNPQGTFDANADKVNFTVPLGDPLQMSSGGTWVALVTPQTSADAVRIILNKTTGTTATDDGYAIYLDGNRAIHAVVDDGTSRKNLASSNAAFAQGERFLITATLSSGTLNICKNGTQIATDSTAILPSDVEAPLAVGNAPSFTYLFTGDIEFVAMIPGVALTQTQIAAIAAQCGPLG